MKKFGRMNEMTNNKSRDINDLNEFATLKLGYMITFAESTLFAPEEIEESVGKKPETDMLVHASTSDINDTVMLITTDYPEYKPWALLVQDEEGEQKSLEFFEK
jgi:hypothetical protein